MACKTETTKIGKRTLTTTQWPADKAFLMKLKLVKIFGAPIAALASGMSGNSEEQIKALAEGTSTLFKNADEEQVFGIIRQCIIQNVFCDGERIVESNFNEVFQTDDIMDIYKVFLFVIKTNYGNLFKGQKAQDFLAKVQENV